LPHKPLKPCSHPGCPNLTHGRYCPRHMHLDRRAPDLRPSARQRGYTTRWDKIRRHVLASEPVCRRCAAAGRTVLATVVHHRDRNPRNNERYNLEPLCTACHELEHAEERRGRGEKIAGGIPAGTGEGASREKIQRCY